VTRYRAGLQADEDGVGNAVGSLQGFLERHRLDRLLSQHVGCIQDALRELLGIIRLIGLSVRLEGEVEHGGRLLRIPDTIGDNALDRDGLKVARGMLKDEGRVPAADRHRDERCGRRIVERRETGSRPRDGAASVFHQVGRWLNLDESKSEHDTVSPCKCA